MEKILYSIENIVCGVPLIITLMFTHIFFTLKLKIPQRNVLNGLKYIFVGNKKNTSDGISSYKSLMTVLAGTLGTGNIVGVGAAILIGGVGSIFWMFLSGIFAIATKYAETYIVLKYRKNKNKNYYGGTMYVLEERVGNKKLAVIFSLLVVISTLGMGALIQANSAASAIIDNCNININVISLVIVLLSAYMLFGNEKRISNISSIFIPIAIVLYLICSLSLLFIFRTNIIYAITLIIKEAFDFKAISGGIFSSVAIAAISSGLSKGLFTNEAGMGTSPLFDVTVNEKDIKKQSIISSTSVFIDTVVICTIMGIIFTASNMYEQAVTPVILAKNVFSLLPFGNNIYMLLISIFAFSTIPCSGYYGSIGIRYLFRNKKVYEILYKLIYLAFVYVGCMSKSLTVWSIASIANALMILPNIYMLFYLAKEIE